LALPAWQGPPQAVQVGPVTVVASPARQSLGIALAEAADRPLDWPGLGRQSPPPFTLVLVDDSASLARYSRGRAPGWGAGLAFPAARTVLLRADLPGIEQTLHHELAHLVLRTAVTGRVPLWFDEGYASWASGELGRMEGLELNLAVAMGKVPSLEQLDAMLRGSATAADLAYALAASAVAEIDARPPPGGLGPLLARLQEGEPFDSAMVISTGLSIDRFEEQWQLAIKRRYSLLTWLVAGGMWGLIAFSLAGLLWYRRRGDIPRRAALDEGWVVETDEESPEPGGRPPNEGSKVDPGAIPQ
jgi:hypothetical protein